MMGKSNTSAKKQQFMMKLAKLLFDPEIIFDDESVLNFIINNPCVIISNHSKRTKSNKLTSCDGPILRYVFENRNICSLMGADLMKKPFFKAVVSGCDCIPVSRTAASTDWIHKCIHKLKEGVSVIIFPEGTTFKEKDVDRFKPGFALLAGLADVPVIPVTIAGKYRLFSKNKLKIRVGTPINLELSKKSKCEYEKETLRFQKIIKKMHTEINQQRNNAYTEIINSETA